MQRLSLNIPPGLNLDDTIFTVGQAGWVETDKVRFHRGRPEVIGGWEALSPDKASGVCRGLFQWRQNNNTPNIAVGTNTNLYVYQAGDQIDITPTDFISGLIDGVGGLGYGTGAYSIGLYSRPSTADFFPLAWSFASYGETLLANPRGQTIWQWSNDVNAVATTLGRTESLSDDLTSYADQIAFDVVWTRGTGWTFDAPNDQADCDGTQTGDSNVTRDATGLTVNKWYRVEIAFSGRSAGAISAIGGAVPNEGTESTDSSGTVVVTFLAASTTETVGARADADFVGSVNSITVYELNAPDNITCIVVPSQRRHVVAYGCNEEATDVFNPRAIRWCDFEDLNDWASLPANNAGEFVLEGSGRIVRALEGPFGTFIWTSAELWFQEFVGAPGQTYRFTRVGVGCGLAGPNAAVVYEGFAYWISPDFSFWRAAPGQPPEKISSPIQDELEDQIAEVQQDKIYASTVGEYGEVVWFYPDKRDGNEVSRYYAVNVAEGSWSAGRLARTAHIDAGSLVAPVAVEYDAENDESTIYYHERGTSANGGPIEWSMTTGDFYISEGGRVVQCKGVWPDIERQQGVANLTITTKQFPQGDERINGPFPMTPSQDRVHFLVSGRIMRFKFSGNAGPCQFRLGRVNMELNARGSR